MDSRQIPFPSDSIFDYDRIINQIEKLKADYSTNPHVVQMIGEDHGYIIEVYFYSNPNHHEFFWVKSIDNFGMAVQLSRELASLKCTMCGWQRQTDLFVAQQFLKNVRFNNIPHIISAATLDRPILPKNKITEFIQYEMGRHFREKHQHGIHAGNSSSPNEQKDEETKLPQEHPTNHQP